MRAMTLWEGRNHRGPHKGLDDVAWSLAMSHSSGDSNGHSVCKGPHGDEGSVCSNLPTWVLLVPRAGDPIPPPQSQ